MGGTCSQARSQSLGSNINDMGPTEQIKKTSNEMDGRHAETSRQSMGPEGEGRERLEGHKC